MTNPKQKDQTEKSEFEQLIDLFQNVPAMVISGKYHLGHSTPRGNPKGPFENIRFMESTGLTIDPNEFIMTKSSSNDANNSNPILMYEALLNKLCTGESKTLFPQESTYPIKFRPIHTASECYAQLSDPTLDRIKAADQPVGEFMEALHSQRYFLKLLYRFTIFSHHEARNSEILLQIDNPTTQDLGNFMAEVSTQYFAKLNDLLGKISVPTNNRMDYLIRETTPEWNTIPYQIK